MSKKRTITVDNEVYLGLHSFIGRRRISRFLNDLARPHVLPGDLAEGYKAMTADEERERDATEWVENLTADFADEPDRPPQRGEVWWVALDPSLGDEIRKTRPAVVVSNDVANRKPNRVQVVPFVNQQCRAPLPVRSLCQAEGEQRKAFSDRLSTISKLRLRERVGPLNRDIVAVERAICVQLGL